MPPLVSNIAGPPEEPMVMELTLAVSNVMLCRLRTASMVTVVWEAD